MDRLVVGERLHRRPEDRLAAGGEAGGRPRGAVGAEPARRLVPADVEQRLDRARDRSVVALGERRRPRGPAPSARTRSRSSRRHAPRGARAARCSSSGSSGVIALVAVDDTSRAQRNSSSSVRPLSSESSSDARSTISALWLMSPKSTIPVTLPSSSARALSVVRSVWTTWARSDGQTGTTAVSNRSRTASTSARCCVSRIAPSSSRLRAGVLDVPEHRPLGSRVEEAAQRPAESGRHRAPARERAVGQGRSRRSGRGRAGWSTPGRGAASSADIYRDASVGGIRGVTGRTRDEPRDRQRQRWVDPLGVEDGERLHVERGRILGCVRHLEDRQRRVGAVEQQERLVAFAAEIRRRLAASTSNVRRAMSTTVSASNAGRAAARTRSMVSASYRLEWAPHPDRSAVRAPVRRVRTRGRRPVAHPRSPSAHDQHRRTAQGRDHRARRRALADPRLPPHQDGSRLGPGAHHAAQRQARSDDRALVPGRHEVAARAARAAPGPVPVPRRRRVPFHGHRHVRPVRARGPISWARPRGS